MFVEPTWVHGTIYYVSWVAIPLICMALCFALAFWRDSDAWAGIGILFLVFAFLGVGLSSVGWHYQYEVPSVQEKIITVDDWQPTFGKYWGDIDGASDLMLKTTDGELFGNEENFLFQKFNTRDVLDVLKPNGTYKIKYYGWREGYNNGVPNILSVEEVINETGCPAHHDITDYMNKRSVVFNDNDARWYNDENK